MNEQVRWNQDFSSHVGLALRKDGKASEITGADVPGADLAKRRDNLVALIDTYNESSSPSVARTDTEHEVHLDRASMALGSIRRSYIEGVDYREMSSGVLWSLEGGR